MLTHWHTSDTGNFNGPFPPEGGDPKSHLTHAKMENKCYIEYGDDGYQSSWPAVSDFPPVTANFHTLLWFDYC